MQQMVLQAFDLTPRISPPVSLRQRYTRNQPDGSQQAQSALAAHSTVPEAEFWHTIT
jgi:hypothetical protein